MGSTLGFIGAGNMGGAIIKGLLNTDSYRESDFIVSDPRVEALEDLKTRYPNIVTETSNDAVCGADVIILAIKPQIYEKVALDIAAKVSEGCVVVTIAAGITLKKMAGWLGEDRKVVRTMPNTPALVSAGMTALCPGSQVTEADLQTVRGIFEAVGRCVLMPENLMDPYTALAGSSPAWIFMFIEALSDGAVREGVPRNAAYEIAAQAVLGSAKLLLESGEHPAVLKDRVCSPAGTTIEAVATLEERGFRSSIIQAISDCTRRGKELGAE